MARRAGSLTDRTIGGLLWMLWGKGAHALFHLGILAVLARLLTPADFGVVSAALVVIGFSLIFSQIGLGPALVQRPVLEQRHLDTAFVATMVFAALLGVSIAAGAPLVAGFFRSEALTPVLRWLALIFPLQGLALVAESTAKRDLRFRWLANSDVVTYALGYGVVGITLALLGFGLWALVVAEIAKVSMRAIVLIAGQRVRPRVAWDRAAWRELMYFSGGFTIARVANYLAGQGDNLVVGRALGPVALGIYGRAYQLMAAPATGLGGMLDSVLFPAMAKVQDDKVRLAGAYRRGVAMLAMVVMPLSAISYLIAPEIIRVALGPSWDAAVLPFRVLAVGMLFRTSYKLSDSLSRATGSVYRRAWRQIVYAALVIGGAMAGQRWGIGGVAVAVVGALAVNFGLMAQLSLQLTGMTWREFGRAHVPGLALAVVCTPAALGAVYALRPIAPAAVVAIGVFGAAGAAALLFIRVAPGPFLGPDGAWMVETLRAFARKRLARGKHAQAGLGPVRTAEPTS